MSAADQARLVAEHHRAELLALADENRGDGRFVSGCSWSLRALDRVLAALDGETDLVALGLKPSPPLEQDGLFGETG